MGAEFDSLELPICPLLHRSVEKMVSRVAHNHQVVGSSPATATGFFLEFFFDNLLQKKIVNLLV